MTQDMFKDIFLCCTFLLAIVRQFIAIEITLMSAFCLHTQYLSLKTGLVHKPCNKTCDFFYPEGWNNHKSIISNI